MINFVVLNAYFLNLHSDIYDNSGGIAVLLLDMSFPYDQTNIFPVKMFCALGYCWNILIIPGGSKLV